MCRTLLIQGWRFLPHSYALVNAFQCLELLRRADLRVFHEDLRFPFPNWETVRGVLGEQEEALLGAIEKPHSGSRFDAAFRISYPFDLHPVADCKTFVFMTAEQLIVPPANMVRELPFAILAKDFDGVFITPSLWSKKGLLNSGACESQIAVIPHGVDPETFAISSDRRLDVRRYAGLEEEFVFLHVGAMTQSKNVGLLLKAFVEIGKKHEIARLILKGVDSLYASHKMFKEAFGSLTSSELNAVRGRVTYHGGHFHQRQMADLYALSDAYVTPYSAEAFNLPALEAASCGLPVICTDGGPTDEFTTNDFALKIKASIRPAPFSGLELAPDLASLISQMDYALTHPAFCSLARQRGPEYIHSKFSWSRVVDRLLDVLF